MPHRDALSVAHEPRDEPSRIARDRQSRELRAQPFALAVQLRLFRLRSSVGTKLIDAAHDLGGAFFDPTFEQTERQRVAADCDEARREPDNVHEARRGARCCRHRVGSKTMA